MATAKKESVPSQDRRVSITGSFNDNLTARPKEETSADEASADADLAATTMDYGEMTVKDAKDSGYTDRDGKAVDMAKKEIPGRPTGAFTDVGAGRSSAVKKDPKKNH